MRDRHLLLSANERFGVFDRLHRGQLMEKMFLYPQHSGSTANQQ